MSGLNRCFRGELELNHENCSVSKSSTHAKLRRMVLASMLFEDQFYIDGQSHYEMVKDLVSKSDPEFVQSLAVEARSKYNLRHIPLMLARELARNGNLPSSVLTNVIQRPDEMGEFLAHYWKDGKQPLSHQVRKGLAACFHKFDEYQFAKWNKNSAGIKIRDVLFLTHAKPKDENEEKLFKKIANDTLETPDTWETQLSAGADKRLTFTRLMKDNKLGALAYLRNLRNMAESKVSPSLIKSYAVDLDVSKVLPYRFIAASKQVNGFNDTLEYLMFKAAANKPTITGNTIILVDVSGSMYNTPVSGRSLMERADAAAAIAAIAKETCTNTVVMTFSDALQLVHTNTHGFNLIDKIHNSQPHHGTYLGRAIKDIQNFVTNYDRVIVITDEQSADKLPPLKKGTKGYIINVGGYAHAITHGEWTEITGFSEAVLDYIKEVEAN